MGELGANLPKPDFKNVAAEIAAVTDIINNGLALACHDISDGGLAVAIAEMCLGGSGDGRLGAKIVISTIDEREEVKKKKKHAKPTNVGLRTDVKLFSETGGFVLEIPRKSANQAKKIAGAHGIPLIKLGFTTRTPKLVAFEFGKEVINVKLAPLRSAWVDGLRNKLK